MSERLLLGLGRYMFPVPVGIWKRLIEAAARRMAKGTRFMSRDHCRVRDFVVVELARSGAPLSAEAIARALGLSNESIESILSELERRLMFLVRNKRGAVVWAYPVTVDRTPHQVRFGTGEEAYSP